MNRYPPCRLDRTKELIPVLHLHFSEERERFAAESRGSGSGLKL